MVTSRLQKLQTCCIGEFFAMIRSSVVTLHFRFDFSVSFLL